MLHWANTIGLPVHGLLTKADKLKKARPCSTLLKVRGDAQDKPDVQCPDIFVAQAHRYRRRPPKLDEWLALDDSAQAYRNPNQGEGRNRSK